MVKLQNTGDLVLTQFTKKKIKNENKPKTLASNIEMNSLWPMRLFIFFLMSNPNRNSMNSLAGAEPVSP